MIGVVLIDDHRLIREGLRMILDSCDDIEVLGVCSNGSEALTFIRENKPDVAIMDISMPEMDGLTATRQIGDYCPSTKVVMLTMHQKPQYIKEAMDAGAYGFLTKNTSHEELVAAVQTVSRGEFYLHPTIAAAAFKEMITPLHRNTEALSSREKDVVRLIAQGSSVAEVAGALFISARTVQTHLYNAMKKLNVHNQRELIFYALREGIISTDRY